VFAARPQPHLEDSSFFSMHPHSAGSDPQARGRSARLRVAAFVVLAAIAAAGIVVPAGETLGSAAAHAAESPRAGEASQPKAPARRKPRAARDMPFGREGDPRKATRTITIETSDTMRYFPEHVSVKKGQTVRINVRNSGALPHEMMIGTMDDLKKHAAMMKQNPEMSHDDANVARVEAGMTGRIVWQFTRSGEFYYGCLAPGHFEAGMIGTIVVIPERR
jgi:uncharacterized cupredoxin-like copper-binding protein